MEYQFKEWLIQQGKPSAAKNYPQAINLVSQHYSKATGQKVNIYEITDQVLISEIAHAYGQSGKYSDYGYEQHSRFRCAINRYAEFFVQSQKPEILTPAIEETEVAATETNFAYETSENQRMEKFIVGLQVLGIVILKIILWIPKAIVALLLALWINDKRR